MAWLLNNYSLIGHSTYLRWNIRYKKGKKMRAPILWVTVIVGIVAVTLFFMLAQESEARMSRAEPPYHLYKLQYSYNGKIWHDLIVIGNGDISRHIKYLRKEDRVPSLRYWHSYVDEEGIRRYHSIPLTIDGRPRLQAQTGIEKGKKG